MSGRDETEALRERLDAAVAQLRAEAFEERDVERALGAAAERIRTAREQLKLVERTSAREMAIAATPPSTETWAEYQQRLADDEQRRIAQAALDGIDLDGNVKSIVAGGTP